jgi:hypothetical protein
LLDSCVFTSNRAISSGTTSVGASVTGGAIWVLCAGLTSSMTVILSATNMTTNIASASASASVAITAQGGAMWGDRVKFNITSSRFTNNSALAVGTASSGYVWAGAVMLTRAPMQLVSSVFTSNSALTHYDARGGAVYVLEPGGRNLVSNCRFLYNIARAQGSTAASSRAGGYYLLANSALLSLVITGSTFIGNMAITTGTTVSAPFATGGALGQVGRTARSCIG